MDVGSSFILILLLIARSFLLSFQLLPTAVALLVPIFPTLLPCGLYVPSLSPPPFSNMHPPRSSEREISNVHPDLSFLTFIRVN